LDGLADAAKLTPDECRIGLEVLLAPDDGDSSGVEEGRRIRKVPGGWFVINHDMYRFSSAEKREFWRQQKAEQRARPKPRHKTTTASQKEIRHLKEFEEGKRTLDQLADNT